MRSLATLGTALLTVTLFFTTGRLAAQATQVSPQVSVQPTPAAWSEAAREEYLHKLKAKYQNESHYLVTEIARQTAQFVWFAAKRTEASEDLQIQYSEMDSSSQTFSVMLGISVPSESINVGGEVSFASGLFAPESWSEIISSCYQALGGSAAAAESAETFDEIKKHLLGGTMEDILAAADQASEWINREPGNGEAYLAGALATGTLGLLEMPYVYQDSRPMAISTLALEMTARTISSPREKWPALTLVAAFRECILINEILALELIQALPAETPEDRDWATILTMRSTDDWRGGRERSPKAPLAHFEITRAQVAVTGLTQTVQDADLNSIPFPLIVLLFIDMSDSVEATAYAAEHAIGTAISVASTAWEGRGGKPLTEEDSLTFIGTETPTSWVSNGKFQVLPWEVLRRYSERLLGGAIVKTFSYYYDSPGLRNDVRELYQQIASMIVSTDLIPLPRYLSGQVEADWRRGAADFYDYLARNPERVPTGVWVGFLTYSSYWKLERRDVASPYGEPFSLFSVVFSQSAGRYLA